MKVTFSQQYGGKAPDIWQRTFSFKKKEWPDEDNIQKMKIEDSNGGAEYSEKLRILSGREHPELFLLWLEDYGNFKTHAPLLFSKESQKNLIHSRVYVAGVIIEG